MDKNLYKKIVVALMISTLGTVSAWAAEEAVVPVDLGQAAVTDSARNMAGQKVSRTGKKAARTVKNQAAVTPAGAIGASDVTPQLREELAQKIRSDMEASAKRAAARGEADPVIVVGRVASDQTVDLTLPKTVQMALDYNRDIKVAHYALNSSDFDIAIAKAGKMPQVGYTWSGARAMSQNMGRDVIGNSFKNSFSVSIPLYTGGLVENEIANAKLGKTNAQEEMLRVQQATKYSAVEGYYALLAYQELRDVYHEAVDNLQGHLDNVTAQYNVGTKAKVDVLSSNVSLANSKTTAVTADNNVAIAESNLNNILGLPLQTKLNLADHQLPFDTYDISLQEAIDYAMKYRPEVLQAAVAVQEAENSIGIAQAGNRPTVSVGAGRGWSDDDFPGIDDHNWSVSGGVSWSLWDGGATNAKIKKARETLLSARETEQKARESVQLEVKQAYLNIRSAAQRVEETTAVVDQAKENYRIQNIRYQAGVGINLDVLDAQLSLNEAQVNHIQALYDYNVGIAKLEQAMGVDVRSGVIHPSLTGK